MAVVVDVVAGQTAGGEVADSEAAVVVGAGIEVVARSGVEAVGTAVVARRVVVAVDTVDVVQAGTVAVAVAETADVVRDGISDVGQSGTEEQPGDRRGVSPGGMEVGRPLPPR
jgi:hypothetical protein